MTRSSSTDDELLRLRRLARVLDSAIPLPGGYRIGLDGIVGLVPVIGDAAMAFISAYIVIRAAQLGASTMTLMRMMGNILLELLVGVVPVLGDLFDFAWKANSRNVEMLERNAHRLDRDGTAHLRLTTATLLLLGTFLLLIAVALTALVGLVFSLLQAAGPG